MYVLTNLHEQNKCLFATQTHMRRTHKRTHNTQLDLQNAYIGTRKHKHAYTQQTTPEPTYTRPTHPPQCRLAPRKPSTNTPSLIGEPMSHPGARRECVPTATKGVDEARCRPATPWMMGAGATGGIRAARQVVLSRPP